MECEEAACKSKVDLFRKLGATAGPRAPALDKEALVALYKSQQRFVLAGRGAGGALSSGRAAGAECPLDREDLGHSTWGLLHTVAAYYPDAPGAEDVRRAGELVAGLAHLYPCTHCREDFRAEVARAPPRLQSRESFALWVCEQHNAVNEKLGKPAFRCSIKALDERWRKGSKACREIFQAAELASESLGQGE